MPEVSTPLREGLRDSEVGGDVLCNQESPESDLTPLCATDELPSLTVSTRFQAVLNDSVRCELTVNTGNAPKRLHGTPVVPGTSFSGGLVPPLP